MKKNVDYSSEFDSKNEFIDMYLNFEYFKYSIGSLIKEYF